MWPKKGLLDLLQLEVNSGAYLMRCVVITLALFETGDEFNQDEHRLSNEVTKLKYGLNTHLRIINEFNKLLAQLLEERKSYLNLLANLTQEVKKLKGTAQEI